MQTVCTAERLEHGDTDYNRCHYYDSDCYRKEYRHYVRTLLWRLIIVIVIVVIVIIVVIVPVIVSVVVTVIIVIVIVIVVIILGIYRNCTVLISENDRLIKLEGIDISNHIGSRLISVCRFLFHSVDNYLFKSLRYRRHYITRHHKVILHMLESDSNRVFTVKRLMSRKHLVKHCAYRIDIRSFIGDIASCLLGRDIMNRAYSLIRKGLSVDP